MGVALRLDEVIGACSLLNESEAVKVSTRFCRHARRQMKWRRISESEALEVLDAPDHVEGSIGERKNAYKLLGGRLLKVTDKEESSEQVVITAIEKTGRGK